MFALPQLYNGSIRIMQLLYHSEYKRRKLLEMNGELDGKIPML